MLSKYSVKKPYTVIVGIILVIVLGVISFQKMTTDLLPSMDLPYVMVYTPYVGATPEQIETEVTRPMEASFATLTNIKKITSSSSDNVSMVIMQFNDGANMDTALIEISSKLDQLRGGWDDDIGAPVAMKLNPDMLPVAILSVTRDDMDLLELSDYVEDELVPAFEALNGVASASASGVIQQRIDVTIEQSRIDVLNKAILRDVDAELADVEQELDDAQAQLSDGKRALARARSQVYGQIDDALEAIRQGESQITPAIEQLTTQREELVAKREEVSQAVQGLEQLVNMDDEQKAQLKQMTEGLAQLRQQKASLEEQLAQLEAAMANPEAGSQRADLTAQRDELAAQLAEQQQYMSDLKLLDGNALQGEIDSLRQSIASNEGALDEAQQELARLKVQRDETQQEIDTLDRQIAAAESESGPDTPDAPTDDANPTGEPEPTEGTQDGASNPDDDSGEANPPEQTGDGGDAPAQDNPTEQTGDTPAQDNPSEQTGGDAPSQDNPTEQTGGDAPSQDNPTEQTGDTPTQDNPTEQTGDTPAQDNPSEQTGDTPTQDNPSEQTGDTPTQDNPSEQTGDTPAQDNPTEQTGGDAPSQGNPTEQTGGDAPSQDNPPEQSGGDAPSQGNPTEQSGGDAPSQDNPTEQSGGDAPSQGNPTEQSGGDAPSQGNPTEQSGGDAPSQGNPPEQSGGDAPAQGNPSGQGSGNERAFLGLGAALAEEVSLDDLRDRLATARETLSQLDTDIQARSSQIDALSQTLAQDRQTLDQRVSALASLTQNNEDIQSRLDEAQHQVDSLSQRIEALEQELASLDQQQAVAQASADAMRQGIAEIDAQIAAIEGSDAYKAAAMLEDPDALNAQYAEAQNGLSELDAGIAKIDETLEKLKQGIIPAGYIEGIDEDTKLSDAKAQLEDARRQADSAFADASSKIRDGESELAKARKEFNEKRDDALENAGLDGVITVQMVSQLIGAQNFAMPAGYVYDAENEQVLVRVGEKFDTLDGVRRMKLFNLGLDSVDEVRLLDVASVELTDDREDVFTKLDGADGILLSLDKQSTYSTADVAQTVLDKAQTLMDADTHLHIVDLMNQGEYINIIVDSVLQNLLYGGGLAILILLLFLMDIRPTITVAFSIPISVVIAFVCMYFSNMTLNVLSLSGLSLGIGMLVDNSIVSIENIYRLHDEEHMPLLKACVEGVKSVSGALFASTLTTICVFLPILFVQGMARDLFSDMGLSIAYSLLASLFVAMTVVPAMCSFLMRHSKPHKHRIFGAIQRLYAGMLRFALRFKPVPLLLALGLLAFAVVQVPKMGISFMPEVNSRQMSASLVPDPEMTDREQKDLAVAIMNDMMAVEGVESVGLMGGSGGMLSSLTGGGGGMSYYIMIDESKGRRNADIAREMEAIGEKHSADLSVQASTMDISMLTGSGISVEITGDELDTLQAIAVDIAELARQTEGTQDVDDGLEDAVPEMRITVDKEKAIDEGLTTAQVFQFVAMKVADRVEITKVTLDGKELGIYLQDGENLELRPEDLEDLEIEVDGEEENKLVRIGDVASIANTQSLGTINRSSQRRTVTVSFGIANGYSANLVSDAFAEKLKAYDVPNGCSATLAGENETVMAIMEDLVWMVLVAILLIFLIMVAQFQSFKSPIIIMFTLPLAFTGGLLALLATRMDLSIVSMIGFLVLSGVVVNNGIVFIDCVNQLRIGGMEKREALIETGRIRLRPILMTALTTILGMSTMAMGQGTGAEMMQPMAVVTVGGLSYATLMTLFIVPVLYDLLNGKTMRAREIQMIREAAGMAGDAPSAEAAATAPETPAAAPTLPTEVTPEAPAATPTLPTEVAPEAPAATPTLPTEVAPEAPATASTLPTEVAPEAPAATSVPEAKGAEAAPEAESPHPSPVTADSFLVTPPPSPAKPLRVRIGPKR